MVHCRIPLSRATEYSRHRQNLLDICCCGGHHSGHIAPCGGRNQFSLPLRERILTIERNQTRINEQIRVPELRVVAEDGEQLGILATEAAMERAREVGLDLVEVAPNEKPPVCRIMDYGKYKYQRNKKANKGHVHHTKTKEIRLRPKTGKHDIDFKVKQATQFLAHKDKVQVSVVFRGREIAHVEEGRRVMQGVIDDLMEIGKLETPPSQQGRRIVCTIAPK